MKQFKKFLLNQTETNEFDENGVDRNSGSKSKLLMYILLTYFIFLLFAESDDLEVPCPGALHELHVYCLLLILGSFSWSVIVVKTIIQKLLL